MERSEASLNNNWWTPHELFAWCVMYFKINPMLDVAADDQNRKCLWYMTEEQDALTQDWIILDDPFLVDVWCNPPNSKVKAFIIKAVEQWKKLGITIVMIVPVQTLTSIYFRDYCYDDLRAGRIEWQPIWERPIFLLEGKPVLDKNGKPQTSRNGYISLCFRGKKNIEAHTSTRMELV